MGKRTAYIISIAILLAFLVIFFFNYQSPIQVVETTIESVQIGSKQNVNLKPEDVAKIDSFFSFVKDNQLGTPEVKYREIVTPNNQSQVIADFQVVSYKGDNSVNKIYGGNMVFYTTKKFNPQLGNRTYRNRSEYARSKTIAEGHERANIFVEQHAK